MKNFSKETIEKLVSENKTKDEIIEILGNHFDQAMNIVYELLLERPPIHPITKEPMLDFGKSYLEEVLNSKTKTNNIEK